MTNKEKFMDVMLKTVIGYCIGAAISVFLTYAYDYELVDFFLAEVFIGEIAAISIITATKSKFLPCAAQGFLGNMAITIVDICFGGINIYSIIMMLFYLCISLVLACFLILYHPIAIIVYGIGTLCERNREEEYGLN